MRKLLKRLSRPVRGWFDRRFASMHDRFASLDSQHQELLERLNESAVAPSTVLARIVEETRQITTELDARTSAALKDQDGHLVQQITEAMRIVIREEQGLSSPALGGLGTLDSFNALVANYAHSHAGWASQAGLWFNPPISVNHAPGSVTVADINERVAEIPFAYASITSALPRGSRVLDVGASESTVAIGLASLGYRVTALDPRPYPLAHSNLVVHVGAIDSFESSEPFDGVVMLSSIEHFGLGAYDLPVDPDADVKALEHVFDLLRPGGMLVLTTPYGYGATTEVQRTYTPKQIDIMFEKWNVVERSYLRKVSRTEWTTQAELDDFSSPAVVLIRAVRPVDS